MSKRLININTNYGYGVVNENGPKLSHAIEARIMINKLLLS